ncbi:hypothetical protein P170DRAFT_155509 [Aspergillus steynii IBT 23096]|uniref:Uncharacterized protein n=1 Tax=Aspergillus steynii IBT 23096 TaxID=1392250 RepID=A0A2I2GDF4_9EURO|nr:uncharacterized protein P170DRAFT_155509 [Aspergillus steynii IBT 23096]PLB50902.1 hypothetical protein P170DRAFT_155509 [Aspergillus steynii IBT 23096]
MYFMQKYAVDVIYHIVVLSRAYAVRPATVPSHLESSVAKTIQEVAESDEIVSDVRRRLSFAASLFLFVRDGECAGLNFIIRTRVKRPAPCPECHSASLTGSRPPLEAQTRYYSLHGRCPLTIATLNLRVSRFKSDRAFNTDLGTQSRCWTRGIGNPRGEKTSRYPNKLLARNRGKVVSYEIPRMKPQTGPTTYPVTQKS